MRRLEFGPPKTDKSSRTLDFPPFVAALLAEHRSEVHEPRRFAGDRWQATTRISAWCNTEPRT